MTGLYGSNWPTDRRRAIIRDGNRCVYCGAKTELHVHHIRPLSRGGTNAAHNLITLCRRCHQADHADIRRYGLATIPGPNYEPYRDELTDPDDVAAYMQAQPK